MGDEWVAKRIVGNIDLVAAKAKYHRDCAQDFLPNPEKLKPLANQLMFKWNSAFSELCAYVDDNDNWQYTVSNLKVHMETFLNGEEVYSLKYFEQKLIDTQMISL
ncbi:MAG: hypothetical protein GY705_08320 [Bacteroidetes bacterium]|nr:hypothetical protein [Bacteroidota bacterium]